MSDTPKTDAAVFVAVGPGLVECGCVTADFAREQERRIAKLEARHAIGALLCRKGCGARFFTHEERYAHERE